MTRSEAVGRTVGAGTDARRIRWFGGSPRLQQKAGEEAPVSKPTDEAFIARAVYI